MLYCVYTYVRALSCIVLTHLYSWWRQCVSVTKYEWTNGHFTWWQLTSCENAFSQSCCPDNRHFRGGSGPDQALIRPAIGTRWGPGSRRSRLLSRLDHTWTSVLLRISSSVQTQGLCLPSSLGPELSRFWVSRTSVSHQPPPHPRSANQSRPCSLSFLSTLIGCLALLGKLGFFLSCYQLPLRLGQASCPLLPR